MSSEFTVGSGVKLPAPPADVAELKTCCAELWSHPLVPFLIGDAFRPGGVALTAALLDAVSLRSGSRVIDVGCGGGASLAVLAERDMAPVGVDYGHRLVVDASARAPAVVGDAERLPFTSGMVDAVLMECVVSALPNKQTALAEAYRVLRPDGWLLLSDVTLSGSFPDPLRSMSSWIACAAGAMTADGYVGLVAGAGLEVAHVADRSADLRELVRQARRRFALLQGAMGVGVIAAPVPGFDHADADELAAVGQELLGQVSAAVDRGDLGYTTLCARRVRD